MAYTVFMKEELCRFAVWSNLFYAAPVAVALYFNLWFVALLISALFAASGAYHFSGEKRFVRADLFFAYAVLVLDAILLYLGTFSWLYYLPAALLFLLALYVRYALERGDRGGTFHGIWHLVAASATVLSIIVYAV